jgi:hypothetical protein
MNVLANKLGIAKQSVERCFPFLENAFEFKYGKVKTKEPRRWRNA